MTLAHISDTHLGFRRFQKTTPTGLNQREVDVNETFKIALDKIAERDPDLVIHSGDLFDKVRPSNATIVEAYTAVQRLQERRKGKPLVIIGGNHETPRTSESGNILNLFRGIEGVKVYTSVEEFADIPELKAEILCVPWPALRANDDRPYQPSGKRPTKILTLHGLMQSEVPIHSNNLKGIDYAMLQAERWDYVALGDFHIHKRYAQNVAYAGSTDLTSSNIWSEIAESAPKKGFVMYDTKSRSYEFVPIDGIRPTLDLPVIDATGLDTQELVEKLLRHFVWNPNDMPVVRQVVLNCHPQVKSKLPFKQLIELRRSALDYGLDIRTITASAAGEFSAAASLDDSWRDFLKSAKVSPALKREDLEREGLALLQEVRSRAASES